MQRALLPRGFVSGPATTALLAAALGTACAAFAGVAAADDNRQEKGRDAMQDCRALPSHAQLKAALAAARNQANGGFNLDMWATAVNRSGVVCAVAYTGNAVDAQWPGSRVISAQKANTANAFSLPKLSLSTANLWAAVQPGGSLYGLQHSNPVDPGVAYAGKTSQYGTPSDPMVGRKIGGVNVFGGGLALYDANKVLVGAVGVSGDTSCADHNIAWRTRAALNLDYVPGGVGPAGRADNINYQDAVPEPSLQADFSHPVCKIAGADNVSAISAALPVTK